MADKTWNGTGGTNGDLSDAANWTPSGVPTTSDDVRFTASYTQAVSANLNALTGVTLGSVVIEKGYSGAIGDTTNDLDLTCTRFEFAGSGVSYIDLQASNITAIVHETAVASAIGQRGLYLIGSNIAELIVASGYIGLASRHGTTATAASVRASGGDVLLGSGATVTNIENHGGSIETATGATTAKNFSGRLTTKEAAAITTITVEGGTVNDSSTGTITTLNLEDGQYSVVYGYTKTITTINQNGGRLYYDPNNVTVSTHNLATDSVPKFVTVTEG